MGGIGFLAIFIAFPVALILLGLLLWGIIRCTGPEAGASHHPIGDEGAVGEGVGHESASASGVSS